MATLTQDTSTACEEQESDAQRNYYLTPPTFGDVSPRETHRLLDESRWPAEADFILSALESARCSGRPDRRAGGRVILRALAALHLYADQPGDEPWMLCTRDATTRGLGFITRRSLPLGYGGHLRVRGPHGEDLIIACTVRRCHESVNGWYEGSISFNREQWAFDRVNTTDAD